VLFKRSKHYQHRMIFKVTRSGKFGVLLVPLMKV
jgi:hypothetical protein